MNKMNKVLSFKQMEIYTLVYSVRKEQTNGKGSYDNKLIIRKIHELQLEDVGAFQVIYVWALIGYLKFWKTQPEYKLLTKLNELSEEEKQFVFFLREMAWRRRAFRNSSNTFFCTEVLKYWESFK